MLRVQTQPKIDRLARSGDVVQVHYRGTLDDGTLFDTTFEDEPITFKLGEGNMLEKFEETVIGLEVGETVIVDVDEADAYGSYLPEQKFEVPVAELPMDIIPEAGMMIQGHTEDGAQHMFMIAEVLENSVIMDANHPLAGKSLRFEIRLVDIHS